ncbi:MAG TPA: universal stress protein [Methanoculleus sp.]|nr:universal stress protein [Methanoculleus sp.]
MKPFEKVLFATDFSAVSARAQAQVLALREAGCEEVVLVHVIDVREIATVLAEPAGVGEVEGRFETMILERMRNHAEQQLKEATVVLEEQGLRVRPHLIEGIPAQEIVRLADAHEVSLIVVGSHGRSNLSQILLGSVSENVLRHARQPVLVVRRVEESPSAG